VDADAAVLAWTTTHRHEAIVTMHTLAEHTQPSGRGLLGLIPRDREAGPALLELVAELVPAAFLASLEAGGALTSCHGRQLTRLGHMTVTAEDAAELQAAAAPAAATAELGADRFTVDEDRAARWLARAAAVTTGTAWGPPAADLPPDSELPRIPAAWHPHGPGFPEDAVDLVFRAGEAGVIVAPDGMDAGMQYTSNEAGGFFRVLVSPGPGSVLLATPALDWASLGDHASPGTGAAAALLQEVEATANSLLGGLRLRFAQAVAQATASLASDLTAVAERYMPCNCPPGHAARGLVGPYCRHDDRDRLARALAGELAARCAQAATAQPGATAGRGAGSGPGEET
jgi:hypothetical protein